jgi:hypothetical protein
MVFIEAPKLGLASIGGTWDLGLGTPCELVLSINLVSWLYTCGQRFQLHRHFGPLGQATICLIWLAFVNHVDWHLKFQKRS